MYPEKPDTTATKQYQVPGKPDGDIGAMQAVKVRQPQRNQILLYELARQRFWLKITYHSAVKARDTLLLQFPLDAAKSLLHPTEIEQLRLD